MKPIVIIGAFGPLGRHLTHRLQSSGYDLRLFSSRADAGNAVAGYAEPSCQHLHLPTKVFSQQALEGTIIWLSHIRPSDPNVSEVEINHTALSEYLIAAQKHGKVERFLYASSGGAIYGDSARLPVQESAALEPKGAYGRAKMKCEERLTEFAATTDVPVHSLRISNLFDDNVVTDFYTLVRVLQQVAISGATVDLRRHGNMTRDFVHVDDVCDAIEALLQPSFQGFHPWNIGSGEGLEIKELVRLLSSRIRKPILTRPTPALPDDVESVFLDVGKIFDELNWAPRKRLQDSLETIATKLNACIEEEEKASIRMKSARLGQ
ncbi:MAG: NAD-dependent epimerase/dehydratase family protein [Paracoccaceae bacterium]